MNADEPNNPAAKPVAIDYGTPGGKPPPMRKRTIAMLIGVPMLLCCVGMCWVGVKLRHEATRMHARESLRSMSMTFQLHGSKFDVVDWETNSIREENVKKMFLVHTYIEAKPTWLQPDGSVVDTWGQKVVYRFVKPHRNYADIEVRSAGPDGTLDTADDIVFPSGVDKP